MPLKINVITDTSRASSVSGTISQYKVEYWSFLWKESGETRGSAQVTFSVLFIKMVNQSSFVLSTHEESSCN